jgi:hypothetical protein
MSLKTQRKHRCVLFMKSSKTITFRPDVMMAEQWEAALAATGAKPSDLVRACLEDGFKTAVTRLIRERKEAESRLFHGGKKRPFDQPLTPLGECLTAVC